MDFPNENRLVIAVASSALFRLDEADAIFRKDGLAAYRKYQREHEFDVLQEGIAFPFLRRFLKFNELFPQLNPVEVVLLSHNDPDTGARVMESIRHYGLNIFRAAFLTGSQPFSFIEPFNVSLFLSANEKDVSEAILRGCAAGLVLDSRFTDDPDDRELRIAFDFDGVLADDSAEKVFQCAGMEQYIKSEQEKREIPLAPGPLAALFAKLGHLRRLEDEMERNDRNYRRFLKTSIITARNGPAIRRLVTTLRAWDIVPDQTFFLGDMGKARILAKLRPHIFFDDQRTPNLESAKDFSPSVHVPFGCQNHS